MYKSNSSRVVPIILILIVVAIAIAALVSVGRALFGGGAPQTNEGQTALLNTSPDHSVRMTVRGPIVADENFRSYQITVDQSSRQMDVRAGYLDHVIRTKQYDNNIPAYKQFVHALDKANLMAGTQLSGDADDTAGICATGEVYDFAVIQAGNVVKHLWTSSCSGSKGSLRASVDQVQNLFLAQIPDSDNLLTDIDF